MPMLRLACLAFALTQICAAIELGRAPAVAPKKSKGLKQENANPQQRRHRSPSPKRRGSSEKSSSSTRDRDQRRASRSKSPRFTELGSIRHGSGQGTGAAAAVKRDDDIRITVRDHTADDDSESFGR